MNTIHPLSDAKMAHIIDGDLRAVVDSDKLSDYVAALSPECCIDISIAAPTEVARSTLRAVRGARAKGKAK